MQKTLTLYDWEVDLIEEWLSYKALDNELTKEDEELGDKIKAFKEDIELEKEG